MRDVLAFLLHRDVNIILYTRAKQKPKVILSQGSLNNSYRIVSPHTKDIPQLLHIIYKLSRSNRAVVFSVNLNDHKKTFWRNTAFAPGPCLQRNGTKSTAKNRQWINSFETSCKKNQKKFHEANSWRKNIWTNAKSLQISTGFPMYKIYVNYIFTDILDWHVFRIIKVLTTFDFMTHLSCSRNHKSFPLHEI